MPSSTTSVHGRDKKVLSSEKEMSPHFAHYVHNEHYVHHLHYIQYSERQLLVDLLCLNNWVQMIEFWISPNDRVLYERHILQIKLSEGVVRVPVTG